MAGAPYHFVRQQGRRLHDDARTPIDDLGAKGNQLPGLFLAQVNVHACPGTQDEAVYARSQIALDQRLETRIVDLALGIERRGNGQVEAGKSECGH
ncbi:hypothetical protein D9M68_918640 [compost metagenome]